MVRIHVFRICRTTSCHSWPLLHNLRSKFNFYVKYDFPTNKGRNNFNTSFLCNFDYKIHLWSDFFSDMQSSLKTEGQFHGQIFNFKVKWAEIWFYQIKLETSVMRHFLVITAKSISGIIFVNWGHPQGQKVNFKVKYI